jgi:hypothetical protein
MAKNKKQKEEAKFVPKGYDDTFDMSVAELDNLAAQIKGDLLLGEDDKTTELEERIKDVNAYFGIKKQVDWPFKGAAKISSKVHQIMVDTTGGNLVSSAIAPEDVISVKTNKSKSIENAKYVMDIHNSLARFEYHFADVIDRTWHRALIESYVVLKPVYQWEVTESVKTVKRWLPKGYQADQITYDSATDTVLGPNGEIIPSLDIERIPEDPEELKALDLHECTIEVTKENTNEGVRVLAIGLQDIFLPRSSPGETPYEKYQRAPFVIHQEYKTIQEMEMLQQDKKINNVEMTKSLLRTNMVDEQLQQIKNDQAGHFDINQHDSRFLTRNVWWYGKYQYKNKLRELVVYMNAETGTILKVRVNELGIRPFFPQIPFPIDGTTGGESLPKRLRSLVTELELILNTLINMGLIKAYPPKYYDPNGGFDPKTLGPIGPNSYIPVRDPSRNVFMPPQPEDPRVLMDMAKFLMDLIERSAANSDAVQGQTSPTANTTAFEVQQALVRAGVRFDIIYRRLRSQLEPMFNYIHLLLLRFMPLEKEIELMGEQAVIQTQDGQQMSRLQAIYQQEGMHGLTLSGNSITEEQKKMQKANELLKVAATPPFANYFSFKPESPYYLLFNLVQYYAPELMDKLLAKPEEVAQLMRDRASAQAEQEKQAVDEGKGHSDAAAQAQMQMAQMEMQIKAQQAQIELQKKQQETQLDAERQMHDMKMKEEEHHQKLRQMEEAHKLKLEMMRTESNAKAKAASKPNN